MGMMIFLIGLVAVGLSAYACCRRRDGGPLFSQEDGEDLDPAKRRSASGEISREVFERIKHVIIEDGSAR